MRGIISANEYRRKRVERKVSAACSFFIVHMKKMGSASLLERKGIFWGDKDGECMQLRTDTVP